MPGVPIDIRGYAKTVKALDQLGALSREQSNRLCQARFKIAVWACKSEGLLPTRENVRIVLGRYGQEVMKWYDRNYASSIDSLTHSDSQKVPQKPQNADANAAPEEATAQM